MRLWADWRLSIENHQFYPESIGSRSEPGTMPATSTIPKLPRRNADAEATDKALTKLSQVHRLAHRVITRHYLDTSTVPIKADALQMKEREYHRLLSHAAWFIVGGS